MSAVRLQEQAKSFLCLIRNAKTSLSTGICTASSKNGESLKMRFFIAAVVAFATMTLDFESFKLNYGLHGMTRGAFTVAAGFAGQEDKVEPAEHAVGTEAAAHPVETNGPSVDSEPVAEVEAPAPEPKKRFLRRAQRGGGIERYSGGVLCPP